jgi:hypothetical protein
MDQRFSGRSRFAIAVITATVAVVLWGFGVELVLHNYVFVLPPESPIQKVN